MAQGAVADGSVENRSQKFVAVSKALVGVGDVCGARFLLHEHPVGVGLNCVKADSNDLGSQLHATRTAGTLTITVVGMRCDLHDWNPHQR